MRALFSRHFFRAPCFFAILLFPQAFSFYLSDERRPVSEDDRFRGDDRHARSPYVLPLLSGRAAPLGSIQTVSAASLVRTAFLFYDRRDDDIDPCLSFKAGKKPDSPSAYRCPFLPVQLWFSVSAHRGAAVYHRDGNGRLRGAFSVLSCSPCGLPEGDFKI